MQRQGGMPCSENAQLPGCSPCFCWLHQEAVSFSEPSAVRGQNGATHCKETPSMAPGAEDSPGRKGTRVCKLLLKAPPGQGAYNSLPEKCS